MSRRVVLGRSGWAGGQRRRSPRICALDARAKTTTTRDRRIKRKRHQLQNVSEFSDQVEDGKRQKDDPINSGKASTIPEKQVLEHILDTLQRRDTYEIFAEPVDPSEVVDYYEIIKEPMDFGTMRAKLHEGMYENLEQFKARAIDELAKRVFHVLENEPENFEPEFAGTRRRSARRAQIESKDCRLSADFNKPAKLTTTTYPKYTLSSAAATSMPEKNSRGSVKPATVASLVHSIMSFLGRYKRWKKVLQH